MSTIKQLYRQHQAVLNYLFFGGLTTLINIVVFGLLHQLTAWNYQFDNIVAWLLSVLFAYITNKRWVFKATTTAGSALVREVSSFFLFRGLSLLLDMLIMWLGISVLGGSALLTKIIDNILVVVINYVFSKVFIFKAAVTATRKVR
ncbi:GtrA family protein [Loigolactobacillus binensis]|uniref:GtrA family protein n=1 Tax=Loigolactobacillus binensis TaxID=2559922 RepID=A0ABW3EB60_9LACO|nr:GtrA family protein [Loigolactobacillus binensis]